MPALLISTTNSKNKSNNTDLVVLERRQMPRVSYEEVKGKNFAASCINLDALRISQASVHLIRFKCVVDDVCDFSYPFALDVHFFVMSFDGIQVWGAEQAKANA
jgi:hypothetical protein